MITPLEIETKEFSKSMRGYNPVEVDDFLDQIIEDMEKLIEDRNQLILKVDSLEKEVKELNCEIGEHKKTEASVMNTLDSAKTLMQDISESAEKRADIILRNARLDAELIMKDAKDAIQQMGEECTELRAKSKAFRQRYRSMLKEELKRMDETEIDLFSDFDDNFDFTTEAFFDVKAEEEEEPEQELRLEDLIEDLTPPVMKSCLQKKAASAEPLDRHTELMSELTSVFDNGGKSHTIPAPKATVALDSKDIDELLRKEEAKRTGADKNTVII